MSTHTNYSSDISLYNNKPRAILTKTQLDSNYSYSPQTRTAYIEYEDGWTLFTSWDGQTYPLDSLADGIALGKLALED